MICKTLKETLPGYAAHSLCPVASPRTRLTNGCAFTRDQYAIRLETSLWTEPTFAKNHGRVCYHYMLVLLRWIWKRPSGLRGRFSCSTASDHCKIRLRLRGLGLVLLLRFSTSPYSQLTCLLVPRVSHHVPQTGVGSVRSWFRSEGQFALNDMYTSAERSKYPVLRQRR